MRSPTRALLAAVVVVSATAGCAPHQSDGGGVTVPSATVTHRLPTAPSTPTDGAGPEHPGGLGDPVVTASVEGHVGPVAVDGSTVAFPFGPGQDWDRVGVVSAGAPQTRIVARSRFPGGLINWVAVSGDWVGYVDQSARQGDTTPDVLWAVRAVDIRTGESVDLASNGDTPDPYVPVVRGGSGHLAWTTAEPDRSARESVWEPGSDGPRTLMSGVEMTPGSETIAGDALVYLGPNGTGASGHTVGGDCWSVSLDGGEPTPLTHTALAIGCAASADGLVWTEHVDPDAPVKPPDGVLDDPYTVSYQASGAQPSVLHTGYVDGSYPLAGAGAVSWAQGRGRVVRFADGTVTRIAGGADAAIAGSSLAYAAPDGARTRVSLVDLA